MLKMVIADDEQIILDGLTLSIDWASYGIEISGAAKNGVEVLQMAQKSSPDIIITDIKMPGINGLELVDKIKKILPNTKIILISAYEQFEFAQEAISLGVMSYIVKPLKKKKILGEVLKARDQILENKQEEKKKEYLEELYYKNIPILREYYLNKLIMGKVEMSNDYSRQLSQYDIEICDQNAGIFVCRIDNIEETSEEFFEKSIQIIHLKIIEAIKECFSSKYKNTVFQSYNNEVVAIYNIEYNNKAAMKDVIYIAENIKDRIRKEADISISIGIGRIYPLLSQISFSYNEAVRALNYRLVYGNNAVIYIDNIEIKERPQSYILHHLNYILINVKNILETGEAEQVLDFIKKKIDWKNNKCCVPYYYIQQVYCQFLSALLETIYEIGIFPEELYDKPVNLYKVLLEKQTYKELQGWYADLVRRACHAIRTNKAVKASNVIDNAICYINENYYRDLSLREVAEHVELNPSYFSRLFREETGIQFIEYLRNIKINKAKELLKNGNKKIYEICEELGYQSVSYFSSLFKNVVGMTPMEYRKSRKD